VKAGYEPLGYLWEEKLASERKEVSVEEAFIDDMVIVDEPIEVVSARICSPT